MQPLGDHRQEEQPAAQNVSARSGDAAAAQGSLQDAIERQTALLAELSSKIGALATRESSLEQKLVQTQERLLRRHELMQSSVRELDTTLEAVLRGDQSAVEQISKRNEYRGLLKRIRDAVRQYIPEQSTVLIVSKGDEELATLDTRAVWHFTQDTAGNYPGFSPADNTSAIVQLEALRSKGADYLVFPNIAFWWFDHYKGFKKHLDRRYRQLVRNEDCCAIFSLRQGPLNSAALADADLGAAIHDFVTRFDFRPAILDWNTGLNIAGLFPDQMVFSPPAYTVLDLPYLDHSIDIVAISAPAPPEMVAEARRVASGAVVTLGDAQKAAGNSAVKWLKSSKRAGLPSASIVIPSYDCNITEGCLTALSETLPADLRVEIIVVDDCCPDDSVERLGRWAEKEPRMKLLRNAQNSRFVVTCNNGAAQATGEILILLNNDTLPQPGWLEALLRTFRDRPDAGAVGGKLVYPDGRLQDAGGVIFCDGSGANFGRLDYDLEAPIYNFVREVDYVTGALLATPRVLFNELGGLDPHYKPAYYEETDYCFKLRSRGYKVYYQPESLVIHLEGATNGTDPGSGLKQYQEVNKKKFIRRWQPALERQPKPPSKYDKSTWYSLAIRDEIAGNCEATT